jgi:hypothetical protein
MVRIGAVTDREKVLIADADALSVTRIVKVDDPTVVGLPVMTPPARDNPRGSDPLAKDQV